MGMDYFIGDFHAGDRNILVYEGRPFRSVQEMDEALVRNWNETVGEDDTGYMLGDVGNPEILMGLTGRLVVVLGNHDSYERIRAVRPDAEISRWPIMAGPLWISHEPIGYMPPQVPYLNVHAHTHGFSYGLLGRTWDEGNRYFCASAEQIGYRPISAREIAARIGYVDV